MTNPRSEPPKTREQFLALPILEDARIGLRNGPERLIPLALLKPEGATYAAKDDLNEWWVLEMFSDGTYGRKWYGCPP